MTSNNSRQTPIPPLPINILNTGVYVFIRNGGHWKIMSADSLNSNISITYKVIELKGTISVLKSKKDKNSKSSNDFQQFLTNSHISIVVENGEANKVFF